MAKTLFDISDDKTYSIYDATYRLAQKSKKCGTKAIVEWAEKNAARQTYGGLFAWRLVLFVLGPFDTTHNDATMFSVRRV